MRELEVVTNADRPDLGEQVTAVFRPVWPEFILHDPVDAEYNSRVATYFAPRWSVGFRLAFGDPDDCLAGHPVVGRER